MKVGSTQISKEVNLAKEGLTYILLLLLLRVYNREESI